MTDPLRIQFTEPNLSAPVLLYPTTACHGGAVYPVGIQRNVEKEVHVFVPKSGVDVAPVENPVNTEPTVHGHVILGKYVPKSPSAAGVIPGTIDHTVTIMRDESMSHFLRREEELVIDDYEMIIKTNNNSVQIQ